ncbi:MAG: hypothetical protein AB7S70_17120 [Hyphomicrobium sp.]
MSKLFYSLEDHFDDLADVWQGSFVGKLSCGLRTVCALAGDVMRPHG